MLCLFSLYFLKERALSAALCLLIFVEMTSVSIMKAPIVTHGNEIWRTKENDTYRRYKNTYSSYDFSPKQLNLGGEKALLGSNFMGQYLENKISVDGYNAYMASHRYMLMASFGSGRRPYMGIHAENIQPYEPFRGMAKHPGIFKRLFFKTRLKLFADYMVMNKKENEKKLDYELRVLSAIDKIHPDVNRTMVISDVTERYFRAKLKEISGWSKLENASGDLNDNAEFLPSAYNTMNLKVSNQNNRILFINTNYHSGWRAFIKDRELPVYKGYFNFMAIPIPVGNFELEMRLHPDIFGSGYG